MTTNSSRDRNRKFNLIGRLALTIAVGCGASGSLLGPQTTLAITTANGETHSFVYDSEAHSLLLRQGAGTGERLTGNAVRVRDARFFISPDTNPFQYDNQSGAFAANLQPRVTIVLALENDVPQGSRDYITYDVQTTISSRVYQR